MPRSENAQISDQLHVMLAEPAGAGADSSGEGGRSKLGEQLLVGSGQRAATNQNRAIGGRPDDFRFPRFLLPKAPTSRGNNPSSISRSRISLTFSHHPIDAPFPGRFTMGFWDTITDLVEAATPWVTAEAEAPALETTVCCCRVSPAALFLDRIR